MIALVQLCAALVMPTPRTLVYGPGSLEVRLLTAKLAAKQGGDAAVFAGEERTFQKDWRRLMYGKDYADAGMDAPGCARVLGTTEELGECLSKAEALVLVCDDKPLPEGIANTLFNNCGDDLKRIVMLSKIGVSRAKPPGPFGIGGEDAAIQASEKEVRQMSESRGVDMSIVRVGTLKGGGPGNETAGADQEVGLNIAYYNTLFQLDEYMCTSAYDKYTLGVKISKGDPIDMANPLLKAARKSDFDPYDDDSSRVIAASAVVHALRHPSAVELTVSAEKGEEGPPSPEEWEAAFNAL